MPITRHRHQGRLWRRYLNIRRGKDAVAGIRIKNWKQYLLYIAINDPLAIAIIHAQNKMIKALFLGGGQGRKASKPRRPEKPQEKKPAPDRGMDR